jgi:DNA-binding response OmpR family regulator
MTEQALDHTSAQPATILVVEDDTSIQLLLTDTLSSAGFRLHVVETGSAAIDLLEHEPVDLLLLDVMLPDMDGFEVCRHVRDSDYAALPVIMLTAATQQEDVLSGLSSGADDYVTKPFHTDELVLRIQNHLRRRQDARTLLSENEVLRNMLDLVQRQLHAAREESSSEALLRRELLHNVTTHLQSLNNIIDAEIRRLPPGQEREAVQRVRMRVRGAALVYQVSELLQTSPVAIGEVIRTTASALKSIYRPWKRITLSIEGGADQIPARIAAPLAMVINELITNCFKHAFPENRFGAITIDYHVQNNQFMLNVADDGVGIPAEPHTGHGRATIQQLVASLGGSVAWHSSAPGTRVELQVPLADEPVPALPPQPATASADVSV